MPHYPAVSELLNQPHETREDMISVLDCVAAALLAGSRLATLAASDTPDVRTVAHAEWHALEVWAAALGAFMEAASEALPADLHAML